MSHVTQAPDLDEAFLEQVEPLRRELTAHCYRMLGSVHDAQDVVQEVYLRAWRSFRGFEHRSSVRTWMYTIATNTCLTALRSMARRPLPTGLGQPAGDPLGPLETAAGPWLEPAPDSLLWHEPAPDPATATVDRESVRLAFVAALQHLTAQQRAVLILRDVLDWRAAEVAAALDISVAAVNSTLQRARAHVQRLSAAEPAAVEPVSDARARALLEDYAAAFEAYDVDRIVQLLTEDAAWEMPPFTGWYQGAAAIGRLIATQCPAQGAGDMRMVATSANASPAFGLYMRDDDGVHRAFQLQVLDLTPGGVRHVAAFFDTALFATFGLPATLDGA